MKKIIFNALVVLLFQSFSFIQWSYAQSAGSGTLTVTVRNEETGQPLAGVLVMPRKLSGNSTDVGNKFNLTDANGNWHDSFPADLYGVWTQLTGYGTATKAGIQLGAGQTVHIDLYMTSRPGWVEGTITDTNGNPIPNCTFAELGDLTVFTHQTAYPDAATGYYKIVDVAPGNNFQVLTHQFTSSDGRSFNWGWGPIITVTKAAGNVVNFQLKQTAAFAGSVKDANGNFIKDVQVISKEQDTGDSYDGYRSNSTTDINGNYRNYLLKFQPPGSTYTLVALPSSNSNYVITTQKATLPNLTGADLLVPVQADFVLNQGAIKVTGVIHDANTSVVLKDIFVSYQSADQQIQLNALTDYNGAYSFTNLPPGQGTVSIGNSSNYYTQQSTQNFQSNSVVNFNLAPIQRITVTGVVKDSHSSVPLSGIDVSYNDQMTMQVHAITDANGAYTLSNVPAGQATLSVNPTTTYAPQSVQQNFTTNTTVNFNLLLASTISGIIKDSATNKPIGNITITNNTNHQSSQVVSDALSGAFSFTGLSSGIVDLKIAQDLNSTGQGNSVWERYYYLKEGESKAGVEILLQKGILATIHVVDGLNTVSSLANVSLRLVDAQGEQWPATTDAQGNAQVRLVPFIDYYVSVDGGNNAQNQWLAKPKILTVVPTMNNKVFQLPVYAWSAGVKLSGNVISSALKNAQSSFVVGSFPAGQVLNRFTARSLSPAGYYSLDPSQNGGPYSITLPPSNSFDFYLVTLQQSNDSGPQTMTVRDKISNLSTAAGVVNPKKDLSYASAGGTVEGVVTYKKSPVFMATVSIEDSYGRLVAFAKTDANGAYHMYNVPVGASAYTISAWQVDLGESPLIQGLGVTDNMTTTKNIDIAQVIEAKKISNVLE